MPREAEKIDFEIIHHLPNQLGECPVWDDRENLLYWVDIKARQILRHDPSSEKTDSSDVPGRPGMLALCKNGGLVIAQERGLQRFSFEKGLQEFLVQVEPKDNEKVRINDSKVDRWGRLWLSSMADPSIPGLPGTSTESVFSLEGSWRRICRALMSTQYSRFSWSSQTGHSPS